MRSVVLIVVIAALAAGAWYLLGEDPGADPTYDEVSGVRTDDTKGPVLEAGGSALTADDAELPKRHGAESIRGIVKNQRGDPVAGVVVELRYGQLPPPANLDHDAAARRPRASARRNRSRVCVHAERRRRALRLLRPRPDIHGPSARRRLRRPRRQCPCRVAREQPPGVDPRRVRGLARTRAGRGRQRRRAHRLCLGVPGRGQRTRGAGRRTAQLAYAARAHGHRRSPRPCRRPGRNGTVQGDRARPRLAQRPRCHAAPRRRDPAAVRGPGRRNGGRDHARRGRPSGCGGTHPRHGHARRDPGLEPAQHAHGPKRCRRHLRHRRTARRSPDVAARLRGRLPHRRQRGRAAAPCRRRLGAGRRDALPRRRGGRHRPGRRRRTDRGRDRHDTQHGNPLPRRGRGTRRDRRGGPLRDSARAARSLATDGLVEDALHPVESRQQQPLVRPQRRRDVRAEGRRRAHRARPHAGARTRRARSCRRRRGHARGGRARGGQGRHVRRRDPVRAPGAARLHRRRRRVRGGRPPPRRVDPGCEVVPRPRPPPEGGAAGGSGRRADRDRAATGRDDSRARRDRRRGRDRRHPGSSSTPRPMG